VQNVMQNAPMKFDDGFPVPARAGDILRAKCNAKCDAKCYAFDLLTFRILAQGSGRVLTLEGHSRGPWAGTSPNGYSLLSPTGICTETGAIGGSQQLAAASHRPCGNPGLLTKAAALCRPYRSSRDPIGHCSTSTAGNSGILPVTVT
jgi:hypothetical protein